MLRSCECLRLALRAICISAQTGQHDPMTSSRRRVVSCNTVSIRKHSRLSQGQGEALINSALLTHVTRQTRNIPGENASSVSKPEKDRG